MGMIRKLLGKYNSLSVQIRATIWFFVCSVLQRGISVITTPIFTRLLSTEEYGQFSVFNSWLSIAQIIVTLQLSAGVYREGIHFFLAGAKSDSLFVVDRFVLVISWLLESPVWFDNCANAGHAADDLGNSCV